MCARGVTEDYVVEQVEAWHRTALELLNNRPAAAPLDDVDDGGDGEQAADVSEEGPAPRRKRPTEVVPDDNKSGTDFRPGTDFRAGQNRPASTSAMNRSRPPT
jgi:hypothetical protein